jgi:hypothetical protein
MCRRLRRPLNNEAVHLFGQPGLVHISCYPTYRVFITLGARPLIANHVQPPDRLAGLRPCVAGPGPGAGWGRRRMDSFLVDV